jgi:hypothetical protein
MRLALLTSTVIVGLGTLGIGLPMLSAAASEWTSRGPYSGQVGSFVVDRQNPNVVYATAPAGLFKSTDGGASWAQLRFPVDSPT